MDQKCLDHQEGDLSTFQHNTLCLGDVLFSRAGGGLLELATEIGSILDKPCKPQAPKSRTSSPEP